VSDATRDDAISLLGMPPERIVRVYGSVNVDWWSAPPALAVEPTLERLGLASRPFVLYVGGYDWRKNAEGMMAGLARARARGADLDLVWAGHLQPDHIEGVDAAARRFEVSDFVKRLGYVTDEDLAALHRAARALLLVSRYEGFGLPVIEAMASGCPVVTTNGGSLGEVAGDAALKVDPEDANAIGDALVRLASEPALRSDLVKKGHEQARLFSREAQAHAMARLYRDFLARST